MGSAFEKAFNAGDLDTLLKLYDEHGIPTAVLIADDIQFLESLEEAKEWTAQQELLRGPVQAPPISPVSYQEVRRRRTDEVMG